LFSPSVRPAIRFACLLTLFAAGCAQTSGASSRETWAAGLGGVDQSESLRRLEATRDRLLREPLRSQIRVGVLRSREPAAFSWDDGSVFATRGLLRLLNDDELAAAVAHEVGHVVRNRGGGQVLSLRGHSDATAELEADATGVSLMEQAGVPPASMTSMLLKVRDAAVLAPRGRIEMTQRVVHLTVERAVRAREDDALEGRGGHSVNETAILDAVGRGFVDAGVEPACAPARRP
jgi:hypothetical protein